MSFASLLSYSASDACLRGFPRSAESCSTERGDRRTAVKCQQPRSVALPLAAQFARLLSNLQARSGDACFSNAKSPKASRCKIRQCALLIKVLL